VTFKAAVEATPEIQHGWHRGLQALHGAHRAHIQAKDASRLGGSVDLDSELAKKYPNDSRWDYGIGYRSAGDAMEMAYWVEVHSASSSHVDMILSKLAWLKDWLKNKAPKLDALKKEFVWISSGKTSFTQSSTQAKRLASQGLRHTGRTLRLGR
jgi:hypothetical protein